jgi:hypothetical protein
VFHPLSAASEGICRVDGVEYAEEMFNMNNQQFRVTGEVKNKHTVSFP